MALSAKTLPATLAELEANFAVRPETFSTDLTTRWPSFKKGTIAASVREQEVVIHAFSAPAAHTRDSIPRKIRLTADAVKVRELAGDEVPVKLDADAETTVRS